MKTWSKISVYLGIWSWMLATACGALTNSSDIAGAVQAIQQAPDPSAAVAAYANGVALARNNPKLYEAYVDRMIDLGMPELAYHQAQTLTSLAPDSGRAWGTVAYVEARRGNMVDAVSAINIAGRNSSSDPFVQRTAGEILAWYDVKADKDNLAPGARDGLDSIHHRLNNETAFRTAYDTARKAYQTQRSAVDQPEQTTAPVQSPTQPMTSQGGSADGAVSAPLAPPPDYFLPDYYYAAGPSWVEPVPWWWWQPAGCFVGFNFCPFPGVFVFDDDDFFRFHDHFFDRDRDGFFFHHNHGDFFRGNRGSHLDGRGGTTFFGRSARPTETLGRFAQNDFRSSSVRSSSMTFSRSSGGSRGGTFALRSWSGTGTRSSAFSGNSTRQSGSTLIARGPSVGQRSFGSISGGQSMPMMRSGSFPQFNSGFSPRMGSPSGMFQNRMAGPSRMAPSFGAGWGGQSFRSPSFAPPRSMAYAHGGGGGGFRGGGFSGGRGGGFGHR
ncbi:MAG TPA: hypothetical protein VFD66_04035 [Verrucomicrobiae bacterium]|nr:hypothetical protein [Verrucomicrobiae bacterium]